MFSQAPLTSISTDTPLQDLTPNAPVTTVGVEPAGVAQPDLRP